MSATERERLRGAFGPLKQVAAGLLDVGYVDVGPPDGPAVVLLHGWPYDIHTFAEVWPLLAGAGPRVIVPPPPGARSPPVFPRDNFRHRPQAGLAGPPRPGVVAL